MRISLARWNSLLSIQLRALDPPDHDRARRLLIMEAHPHHLRRYLGTHTHIVKSLFHVTLHYHKSMYNSKRMKNSLGDWKLRTIAHVVRHLRRRTRERTPNQQKVRLCPVTPTSLVRKQVRVDAVCDHAIVIVIDLLPRSARESLKIRRDSIATRSTGTTQFVMLPRTTFHPQSSKYIPSEHPVASAENQPQTGVPKHFSRGRGSSRILSHFPSVFATVCDS